MRRGYVPGGMRTKLSGRIVKVSIADAGGSTATGTTTARE